MVEPEPMNQTETIVHDDEISDPFVSSKRIPETESQPHIQMELPSSDTVQQSQGSEPPVVETEGREQHLRRSRRNRRMPAKFKDFIVNS